MAVLAQIGAAIAPVIGTIAASPFGQVLGSAALGIGLQFISNALGGRKKQSPPPAASSLELRAGGDTPRGIPLGEGGIVGDLKYFNRHLDSKRFLDLVYVLSDFPCDGLSGVEVDGEVKSLIEITSTGTEDKRYHIEDYDDTIVVRFFSGRPGQLADSDLIASSNPAGRVDANDVGEGVCKVSVTLTYTDEILTSLPKFVWILRGALLYSPRFDSTNGGSGPQRYDDVSTWVYSKNAADMDYCFCRGFYVNGQRVLGMGLKPYDLLTDMYIAAANVCAEQLLEGGVTRSRYECAAMVFDDQEFGRVRQSFHDAMAGEGYTRGGLIGVIAGAAQPNAFTLTEDDLVAGRDVIIDDRDPDAKNSIHGQFTNPDAHWQPDSYPSLENPAWVAADGDREQPADYDFLSVTNVYQATRCRNIRFLGQREMGSATVFVPDIFMENQPGDWGTLTYRGETKTYRLLRSTPRFDGSDDVFEWQLKEISAAVFADPGELIVLHPPIPPAPASDTLIDAPLGIAAALTNDGRSLRITITPANPLAPRHRGYEVRYGADPSDWISKTAFTGGLRTETEFDVPVLPGGTYEISVKAQDDLGNQSLDVSTSINIDAPDKATDAQFYVFLDEVIVEFDVPADVVRGVVYARTDTDPPGVPDIVANTALRTGPDGLIKIAATALSPNVDHWMYVELFNGAGVSSGLTVGQEVRPLGTSIDEVSASTKAWVQEQRTAAEVLTGQIITTAVQVDEQIELLREDASASSASIGRITRVQAGADLALASLHTRVAANKDAADASIVTLSEAIVTANAAIATLDEQLTAQIDANTASAATNAAAIVTANAAIATLDSTLTASIAANTASISSNASAIATTDATVAALDTVVSAQGAAAAAQWTVEVDANGAVASIKLGADGDSEDFIISAATRIQASDGTNNAALVTVDGLIKGDRVEANSMATQLLTATSAIVTDLIIVGGGAFILSDRVYQPAETTYDPASISDYTWQTVAQFSIENNDQPFFYKFDYESFRKNPGISNHGTGLAGDQHHQQVLLNGVVIDTASYFQIGNTAWWQRQGQNIDYVPQAEQANLTLTLQVRSLGQVSAQTNWAASNRTRNVTLILMALKG